MSFWMFAKMLQSAMSAMERRARRPGPVTMTGRLRRPPGPRYAHVRPPQPRKSSNWGPVLLIVGILVAVPLVLFLVLLQVSMFTAGGFWVGLGWLLFQLVIALPFPLSRITAKRAARRAKEARRKADLIARANFEHHALMSGEIGLGMYGAFQPANTHHLTADPL